MRRPFFLLFTNAAILIVVAMMLMQSIAVLQLMAVADVLQGKVEVRSGKTNPFRAIAAGNYIKTGDTIRSGADGNAEFRWLDGTRLRLQPNTEITVQRCSLNLKRHAQNSEFSLARGQVFVRIPQKLSADSHFEIDTPGAKTTVRGTIFSVAADAKGTRVAVWKGRVEVANSDDSQSSAVFAGNLLTTNAQNWQLFGATSLDAQNATHEFAPLTNIVSPSLRAQLQILKSASETAQTSFPNAILSGRAEAGDRVLVNGRDVRVRGDGGFRSRLQLQNGDNSVVIAATDRHGATRVLHQTLHIPAAPR